MTPFTTTLYYVKSVHLSPKYSKVLQSTPL
nr:MAG TPA: hypothetical protein [Caudoviricetes sp.]